MMAKTLTFVSVRVAMSCAETGKDRKTELLGQMKFKVF